MHVLHPTACLTCRLPSAYSGCQSLHHPEPPTAPLACPAPLLTGIRSAGAHPVPAGTHRASVSSAAQSRFSCVYMYDKESCHGHFHQVFNSNEYTYAYTRYSVTVTQGLPHSTLQYVVQYNCTLEVLTYIPVQDKHRSWSGITLFAAALPHSPHSAGFH